MKPLDCDGNVLSVGDSVEIIMAPGPTIDTPPKDGHIDEIKGFELHLHYHDQGNTYANLKIYGGYIAPYCLRLIAHKDKKSDKSIEFKVIQNV